MATPQPRPRRANRPQPQYPQQPPQDPNNDYPFGRPDDERPADIVGEANLRVLRMHHPDVESIKYRAHFVHLYRFDLAANDYTEQIGAGPTFVVSLTRTDPDIPRYAIIILNRKNMDVFRIDLDPEEVYVSEDDVYILVENKKDGSDAWCIHIHRGPDNDSAMRNDPELMQKAVKEVMEEMEKGIEMAKARKVAMASAPLPQWAPQPDYPEPVQQGFQQQREGSTASGMQHPYGYPPPTVPSPYPQAQSLQPNPHPFAHQPPYPNMQMQQQQLFQPAFPPPAPSQTQTPNIDINQLFASVQGQGVGQGYNGAR